MGRTGLNGLEKFATASDDDAWNAFIGRSPAPSARQDEIGEPELQELHGIAKAAFVAELEKRSGGDDNALTWALSMVDEADVDAQIAKMALALADASPAAIDFIDAHLDERVDIEDLHGLAKAAFILEMENILGDDALVKEAVEMIDDTAFDTVVAEAALGMSKEAAPFQGLGRAIGGLGSRLVGGATEAVGKGISSWGARAGAKAEQRAARMYHKGARLQAPATGAGPPGAVGDMIRQPGALQVGRGKFLQDRAMAIQSDIAGGFGPGERRMRFGDRLMRKGQEIAGGGRAGVPAPKTAPAPKAAPVEPAPKAAPPPAAPAAGATQAGQAAGQGSGRPVGLWNGFSGWFDRATPLQRTLAIGVPALGAEAALD